MKRICKRAFEAGMLTFGLAACVAALAAGHAGDAPGLGWIGLGIFFACAFAAFLSASEAGPGQAGSHTPRPLRRGGTSLGNHVANSGGRR